MSKREEARPVGKGEKGLESAQTVVDTQGNAHTAQLSHKPAIGSEV